MPPIRRLRAAAFILFGLAAAGTGALAQEASNTVGPPALKDFQLPGQRTTPPATTTTPPSTTPPATRPAPPPAPAATTAERPPEPRSASTGQRRPATVAAPARAAPRTQAPVSVTDAPIAQAPVSVASLPSSPKAAPPPPPAATAARPESQSFGWSTLAAAGGAILLLLLGFFALRRRGGGKKDVEASRTAARDELGGALFPAEPKPKPRPEPEVVAAAAAKEEEPRAWLEIDIKPERAAATDTEATVHYALYIRNRGTAVARNIRIDPRLFNANAEAEMTAFFHGPIHEQSGSPQVTIAPEGSLTLMGQVAMPRAEMREIEVQGLRIFVPMVAINVAYDWGEKGSGRTSRSWLVGREAQTPSAKMGAFRLDLGPRIYRSVGQREGKLVMV